MTRKEGIISKPFGLVIDLGWHFSPWNFSQAFIQPKIMVISISMPVTRLAYKILSEETIE